MTTTKTPLTEEAEYDTAYAPRKAIVDASFARALEHHANELREQLDRARFLLTPFDKWTGVSDFLAKPIPTFTAP